jgi:hypothetical protein
MNIYYIYYMSVTYRYLPLLTVTYLFVRYTQMLLVGKYEDFGLDKVIYVYILYTLYSNTLYSNTLYSIHTSPWY